MRLTAWHFLPLLWGLAQAQGGLEQALAEERERWWNAGHTQVQLWDHSWLTPRLVCGMRFMRVPPKSSIEGGVFLPLAGMGMGAEEILAAVNTSGTVPKLNSPEKLIVWTFDGTEFQERALAFYAGGKPPMEDVWLLALMLAVPASKHNNVMSGSDMLEFQCSAMVLLASYMYAEYMTLLVPPAVLLKYFQHTWEVHSREGAPESATEMLSHFSSFEPLNTAMSQFQQILQARRQAFSCAVLGERSCPNDLGKEASIIRPLVDVVIVRCQEDVSWVLDWLGRVLRDEWTPEVAGLQLRLLVYEKCFSPGDSETEAMAGQQLIDRLLHLGVLHPGSVAINLAEPQGFENVAYVHYCMSPKWRDSDFVIFLHGYPFDHTNEKMLDDVLRSMAQGTYAVPFVHLNIKRLPRIAVEPCLQELIRPALEAWHADHQEHGSKLAKVTDLPFDLSTYCCTQFVVARHRIARVPDSFWSAVWRSLHDRLSVNGTAVEGLDWTCRLPAKRVYEQRAERNGHMPISDYGLWGEVLERAWHWIFGEDALLPPREVDARLPLFLRIPRVRSDVEGGPRGTILDRVLLPDWGFDPGYWGLAPIIGNVTGEATAGSAFSSPIPTAHFARTARTNWQLPDWVAAWLQEETDRKRRV
ncbi:CPK2 [Symbiodinium sp. CCMP2592]|nr:CPK2 [Symbiodinium sp. CCMP2592]